MPIMGVFALTHVKTISQASAVYDATSYPGDYYAWGNCTWWAAMRRSQIGEPVPNSWGNAATWAYYASNEGYLVDHSPSYGAIMQISNVDGGLGHVAFVESVDPDGTWHISEMNVLGLDVVDNKTMPATATAGFNFIHIVEK
jgi:surface antigen